MDSWLGLAKNSNAGTSPRGQCSRKDVPLRRITSSTKAAL